MRVNSLILRGVIISSKEHTGTFEKKTRFLDGNKLILYPQSFDLFLSHFISEILSNLSAVLRKKIKKDFRNQKFKIKNVRVVNIHYSFSLKYNNYTIIHSFLNNLWNKFKCRQIVKLEEASSPGWSTSIDKLKEDLHFIAIQINFDFGTLKIQHSKLGSEYKQGTLVSTTYCENTQLLISNIIQNECNSTHASSS
jgi:hypothetical protein